MIAIIEYGPGIGGTSGCDSGTYRWQKTPKFFDCRTGAPGLGQGCTGGGCNALTAQEWLAYSGVPVGQEPCTSGPPGPALVATCTQQEQPNQCKAGREDESAARDPQGEVGDPVDLTTGALKLTPTDVDLGGGLRFARHYAGTSTTTGPMGRGWRHALEWRLVRGTTSSSRALPWFTVTPPFRTPLFFVQSYDGSTFLTTKENAGWLTLDPDGSVHFVDERGVQADFNASDQLVALLVPGEPALGVSYAGNTTTWSNGSQSIAVTTHASGTNAGRVATVVAGGETWSYGYDASQNLTSVTGPDPSTPSPSDTITWTYVYTTPASSGRVTRLDRTVGSTTTTLGSWTWGGSPVRVTSADEPALEQALLLSYSVPEANRLQCTVKNASNQTMALFDSANDRISSVTNTSGPAAPVPGGPGVPVAFAAATLETVGTAKTGRWRTKTDKNLNVTLYDAYDAKGRPGRIVEGWVDGLTAPGVFSADDSYARRREYTHHPVLDEPLTITEHSALTGVFGDKVTTFDYDDPLDPGDDPDVPNENPSDFLFARIESGRTLSAGGSVVSVTATTRYTYDADGRVTSESGPRPENYTLHIYQGGTGYRTATRRYLNGPSSSYLETTFSNFDARGNPQTATDPNGDATLFTYDTAGRVKTMKPPFTGGDSTITSTYDADGNLTRVDFPPDSFSQPYFVRMGYDAKNRLTFLADAQGNAIVYERTGGRVTREALYAGFVDLSNRGALKGDSTFGYDAAGRMLKAFNPLFSDNSVFTQYTPDAKGNPASVTDENGKVDNQLYDALDRLEQVAQVRGGATYTSGFDYDAASNVKQVTDPAGKATDYVFDDLGNLVKVTSPNTGTTLYLYDLGGNLISKIEDFLGTPRATTYTYDGLDRLTLVNFPTDADWVFTYDSSAALNQKGRLASASNGIVTTELEYTDRGEVAIERTLIGGGSYPVTYGYDAAGNLTSVQAPSGVTTTYAYSGSRPRTVTVAAGSEQQVVRSIEFLPFGPRTRAEFPPFDAGSG
jgi:YD repeat-containing protein